MITFLVFFLEFVDICTFCTICTLVLSGIHIVLPCIQLVTTLLLKHCVASFVCGFFTLKLEWCGRSITLHDIGLLGLTAPWLIVKVCIISSLAICYHLLKNVLSWMCNNIHLCFSWICHVWMYSVTLGACLIFTARSKKLQAVLQVCHNTVKYL